MPHRAWEIPEITAVIAASLKEYVEGGFGPKLSKGSLASLAGLARTCHGIAAVALDELWAEPGDLRAILRLLPSRLWEESPPTFMHDTVVRMEVLLSRTEILTLGFIVLKTHQFAFP